MDIFSTAVLSMTVAALDQPASFLLDAFFPGVQTELSEDIHFDVDTSKPRLAPFVSPLVAGRVVDDLGYISQVFRPAYVKDKRRFDPSIPLRRSIGERIGGNLTPMQRREAALNRSLNDQLNMLTRREEVMASEAMRTGKITVTGDQYPTVVVDFQRNAALTVVLSGAVRWGQAGILPLQNIEDWAGQVMTTGGASPTRVVMDPLAWRLFSADESVQRLLDRQAYGGMLTASLEPMVRRQGNGKAQLHGTIGSFEFWTYQDTYVDNAGVTQKMLPDYTVIMGSPDQVLGTRCYGAIQDEEAGYMAERFFPKSWIDHDPPIRWLMLQSAPLVVPYRVNATFCATVN